MTLRTCIALALMPALLTAQSTSTPSPTVAQRLVELPGDSVVELRLNDKRKVRGRLGELSQHDFEMRVISKDRVVPERFRYEDVKSVRPIGVPSAGRSAGFFAIGALAGIGGLVLILYAIFASES